MLIYTLLSPVFMPLPNNAIAASFGRLNRLGLRRSRMVERR